MIVRWQSDLVNTKESLLCVCNKPYYTNNYIRLFRYIKGGADSGFRRVEPEQYTPRLFHFKKADGKISMTEVQNLYLASRGLYPIRNDKLSP